MTSKQEAQPVFPLSRVKKIIQSNADIGKIQHTVPYVVSRSLELFLEDLMQKCIVQQEKQQKNKLTPFDLKIVVQENQNLQFLNELIKDIPDQDQNKNKSKSKNKKQKIDEPKKKSNKKVKKYQEEVDEDINVQIDSQEQI